MYHLLGLGNLKPPLLIVGLYSGMHPESIKQTSDLQCFKREVKTHIISHHVYHFKINSKEYFKDLVLTITVILIEMETSMLPSGVHLVTRLTHLLVDTGDDPDLLVCT